MSRSVALSIAILLFGGGLCAWICVAETTDKPMPKDKQAPEFADIGAWINSEPLTMSQLRGKVVVIHFWTFGCVNCIRNLPHIESLHKKFARQDVVIVGIHTPETEAEKNLDNVRDNVKRRKIEYPVAVDGSATMWNAWGTRYWPSVGLVDRNGDVRYVWEGELNKKGESLMGQRITELLAEPVKGD